MEEGTAFGGVGRLSRSANYDRRGEDIANRNAG